MLKIQIFLVIIFLGMASVIWNGGRNIIDIFEQSDWSDFLSGKAFSQIDKAVVRAMPKSDYVDGLVSGFLYSGLHDAGSQVWAGCGTWLFLIEELRVGRRDQENINARARIFGALAKEMKSRNIDLVVLPVPDKAELVEDRLCGPSADQSRFRANAWAKIAESLDPIQIDIRNNWPRPGYWRTDSHWDRQGARFAANIVANVVNEKLGKGKEAVILSIESRRNRIGDLARLAGLADAPSWLAPTHESETIETVMIERTGGLLDETPSPAVILAGSSFSLNSGFLDYLQLELAREVAQKSQPGSGFAGALLEVLAHEPKFLADVRVLVWEWPMRSLSRPLTDSEHQFLKKISK